MTAQRPILRNAALAAGLGTPVLLVHGSASSSAMWTPVIHALKARFRLIAPDLIGYGRTDAWPEVYELRLDDELRLIEPLIEHLPGGVHVVAHSYGGVVALALACAGRVGIRSLTLIEPVAFHMARSDAQAWAEVERFSGGFAERMAKGEVDAAMRHFVDYWSSPGTWETMDEGSRAHMRRAAPKIMHEFHAASADPLVDALRDVAFPVRLIAGDRSPLPVRRIAALIVERLPNASLRVIAGANHLLPSTHHRVLSEWLLETLGGDSPTVRPRETGCVKSPSC
jgi:pimeloyl-ACP methyl ester carboxylesterase